MEDKIPMLDTQNNKIDVPSGEIQKAVEDQLKNNNWVTLEKNDGTTEILTPKDLPKPSWEDAFNGNTKVDTKDLPTGGKWEDKFKPTANPVKGTLKNSGTDEKKPKEEWVEKFAEVKSAVATKRSKGG